MPHVLKVIEIKPLGVAVLKGSDVVRIEVHIKNIAHNPLPILDYNTHLERLYRGSSVHFRVCGTWSRGSKMVLCDKCN